MGIQLRPVGVNLQPMSLAVPFFSSFGCPLQDMNVVVGIPVVVSSITEGIFTSQREGLWEELVDCS